MYAMNAAAHCTSNTQPYCADIFAYFNRANYVGEAWGLTVDWIYPYLSASDRATIRAVFLKWANAIVNAGFAPDLGYVEPPVDLTSRSNTQLLSNKFDGNNARQFRFAANNYYSGAMRDLTLMVLSMDPADDPPVDAETPASALGNTLRSYLPYLFNVALYQQYAMYEQRDKVIDAYQLQSILSSVDGPGLASGGLSVEGFLYGHSLGYIMEGLLGLHTAGYDDASVRGPQANLFSSGYWDLVRDGFLSSLTLSPVPPEEGITTMPVYQMASYGDLLFYFITDWDYVPLIASLGVRDGMTADTAGRDKALWALVNTMPGGQANLTQNLANAFVNSGSSTAILAYMALDPAVPFSAYPDPRPQMPRTFYSPPVARLLDRTDWTPDATWFDHYCSWESINHEDGYCGQFELYRKGEWLTAERPGYDNAVYKGSELIRLPANYAPDYHNTLSIQNDMSHVDQTTLGVLDLLSAQRGGQWMLDANAGDPVSVVSAGDTLPYAYVQDDLTNLYNRIFTKITSTTVSRATAVKHASRSMLWHKPDHLVLYDRATTGPEDAASTNQTLFKRFNLLLLPRKGTTPSITPNAAGYLTHETTPAGQSLYVQTLLPAGIAPVLLPLEPMEPAEEMDPTLSATVQGTRFRVEDPGATSNDTRFLHVLQGADPGQAQDAVTLLASDAGTAFQGVSFATGGKSVVVLFLSDLATLASFSSTSYPAPAGANDDYVVDLTPLATYYVTTGATVSIRTDAGSGGTAMTADAGGVLHFMF
jgi:hypothetical protein